MAHAVGELARTVKEVPGHAANPRILAYHRATTYQATSDEVPWCSSFVNWCLQEAGVTPTRSAAARSWLKWGEPLLQPRYGAITVLSRGLNPAQGHVGFFVSEQEGLVFLLGGNQSNAVSINGFRPERIVGIRWPA
jgi:uncharacterized protein (TIGR02594 family)